jgi:hypothetical protein
LQQDLATLLKKLSDLCKEQKEACDKAKKKVDDETGAKKPAACKVLLQGGDASTSPYASASRKTNTSVLMVNVNVHSREGEMEGATTSKHIVTMGPCVKPTALQANITVKSEHMASVTLTEHSSTISCSTVKMEVETSNLDHNDNTNTTVLMQ